jgi:hypothetical protein
MEKISANVSLQEFRSHMQMIFTCRKILRHGVSGFACHPKEGALLIFIALAGFEPATLGSSG